MDQMDSAFTGSIPEIYETKLVPALFEPYADDLSKRVAAEKPQRVLELAAGTGALTRWLVKRLPQAHIVATDLNEAMLEQAERTLGNAKVRFEVQDAMTLPYDDSSFDVVVAQFGVMFFPDKIEAFRESRRVLRSGGMFAFNAWAELAKNPVFDTIARTFTAETGKRSFFDRAPFSYCDRSAIASDLCDAGFADVEIEHVAKTTRVSAWELLDAGIAGSPFSADFKGLERASVDRIRERIRQALTDAFGTAEIDNELSAVVVRTRK